MRALLDWGDVFSFQDYGELLALLSNSIIAGAVLGIVGGLVGVFVMQRDLAFAVHGVSELSFAGAAAALLFGGSVVAGSLGGALVAKAQFGVDVEIFLKNGRDALKLKDLYGGLLKALAFGLMTASVACSQGLRCGNGPEGVGRATLRAVVVSFIFVLAFDYLLTWIIGGGGV